MRNYVHMSGKDNLVTCVRAIRAGETLVVDGREITALDNIPVYHKMAVSDIRKGEPVYKYGQVMSAATQDIRAGQWAHIHNIESTRGRGDRLRKEAEV